MQRTLLTLLFLVTLLSFSLAQGSFTINPVPALGEADLQDPTTYPGDVIAHAEITNNTSETLMLRWVRTEVDLPDMWATGVCDVNYCYGSEVSRREFELAPNATGTLDVHAYPSGIPGSEEGAVPGEAQITVRVVNVNDATDTLTGVYLFDIVDGTTSIVETEVEQVKLFPNPATNYFELSANPSQVIRTVAIHNILGRQVSRYPVNDTRFDIADLPNGMYLVSLLDEQEAILKTMRLQKH
ncbi:MAG: T9SS type A sorting domain-containing protein [Bacteroidota bacterium]